MEPIYLSISNFFIKITFIEGEFPFSRVISRNIQHLYSGFIVNCPKRIDYEIQIIQRKEVDILNYKKRKKYIEIYEHLDKTKIRTYYYISGLQFRLLLRDIIVELLEKKGDFMIHASALEYNKFAYLFVGKSGVGKSTIVNLLDDDYQILADDSGILRKENDNYYFYQSILNEKKNLYKDSHRYPLGGIFFLKQTKQCRLKKIDDKESILDYLLKQIWGIQNKVNRKQIKNLTNFVNQNHLFYILGFNTNALEISKIIDPFLLK